METSTCLMTPNHRLFLLSLGVGHWLASLYGSSESLYQPHWRLVKPTCSPVSQHLICNETELLSEEASVQWIGACAVLGEVPLFCSCTPGQPESCGSELGQAFLPMLYLVERKKHTGIQGRDEWDRISQNDTIYNIQFKKGLPIFLRSRRKTIRLLTVPIPSRPLK